MSKRKQYPKPDEETLDDDKLKALSVNELCLHLNKRFKFKKFTVFKGTLRRNVKRRDKCCIHAKQKAHCKECGGSSYCKKHGIRKQNCKECGGSAYCKKHGKLKQRCKECGGSSYCKKHGIRKAHCKECGGSAYCKKHGIQKIYCKECGGSAYCEKHGIRKEYCKKCGGSAYCKKHGINKQLCKECGGSAYCKKHGINKQLCKECGGSAYCKKHGILKRLCKECGGSAYCEKHGIRKIYCKECGGSAYCEKHGILKQRCKECGGSAYCEKHGILKQYCKECGGSAYCEKHGILKQYCKECGGSKLCECGKIKQKDGCCISCHSDYIESGSGVSKIGCEFFDCLQKQMSGKIQHSHYDTVTKDLIRNEYRPPEKPSLKIDGMFVDSNTDKRVFIEYLGDVWHGHPRLWIHDEDATNHVGLRHKDLFGDAEMRMQLLQSFGYTIVYIWGCDYRAWKRAEKNRKVFDKPISLSEYTRIFDGKLEWQ